MYEMCMRCAVCFRLAVFNWDRIDARWRYAASCRANYHWCARLRILSSGDKIFLPTYVYLPKSECSQIVNRHWVLANWRTSYSFLSFVYYFKRNSTHHEFNCELWIFRSVPKIGSRWLHVKSSAFFSTLGNDILLNTFHQWLKVTSNTQKLSNELTFALHSLTEYTIQQWATVITERWRHKSIRSKSMRQVNLKSFSQVLESSVENFIAYEIRVVFIYAIAFIPLCFLSWNLIRSRFQVVYRDISYGRPFDMLEISAEQYTGLKPNVYIFISLTIALISLLSESPQKLFTEATKSWLTKEFSNEFVSIDVVCSGMSKYRVKFPLVKNTCECNNTSDVWLLHDDLLNVSLLCLCSGPVVDRNSDQKCLCDSMGMNFVKAQHYLEGCLHQLSRTGSLRNVLQKLMATMPNQCCLHCDLNDEL